GDRGGLPGGGKTRPVRKDDGLGRRRGPADACRGREEQASTRDRLPALLQPDVSGRLRKHHPPGIAWGGSLCKGGMAPKRLMAANRGSAAALRSQTVGLS